MLVIRQELLRGWRAIADEENIVGGEQKRELLKKCYLFALPTRYPNEGQPISILEAMGNGMFIITTDHAGIPDIVEDGVNGIVMKNKENAYSKVASFKANELKTVCKRNREYCKEMYTEKRYLHMMETRFKEN